MGTYAGLLAIVLFALSAVSQAQVVEGPRAGFAVITSLSGNQAGLVPVETLFNRTGSGLVQTDIPPSPILTNAVLPVNLGTIDEGATAIAIVNPSSITANLQLIVTSPQGFEILRRNLTIGPRRQLSRFLTELFPGQIDDSTSRIGLLTITSEVPIAVLSLTFRELGISATPVAGLTSPFPLPSSTFTLPSAPTTPATISLGNVSNFGLMPLIPSLAPQTTTPTPIGGTGSFIFPQVVQGGDWATQITIANTSTSAQIVQADFFDANGNRFNSQAINIPARGLFVFSSLRGGVVSVNR